MQLASAPRPQPGAVRQLARLTLDIGTTHSQHEQQPFPHVGIVAHKEAHEDVNIPADEIPWEWMFCTRDANDASNSPTRWRRNSLSAAIRSISSCSRATSPGAASADPPGAPDTPSLVSGPRFLVCPNSAYFNCNSKARQLHKLAKAESSARHRRERRTDRLAQSKG